MSITIENPLVKLIGTWQGKMGVDIAPKPDEDENNPYYETLIIEPVDSEIENAEEQELLAVRYHQVIREIANDKISHSETGYWLWDKNENNAEIEFAFGLSSNKLEKMRFVKRNDLWYLSSF